MASGDIAFEIDRAYLGSETDKDVGQNQIVLKLLAASGAQAGTVTIDYDPLQFSLPTESATVHNLRYRLRIVEY